MDMRGLRLTLESALKHLLRGDVLSTIKLYDSTIIKRIGVARQRAFRPQTRFGDVQVSACARGHFRNARVLFNQGAELQARFAKTTASELLVGALESA